MSDQPRNAVLAMDEREPPYDSPEKQPQTLTRNRHIDDILYVAGRAPVEGQANYDIMFIAAAVDEDEATQHSVTTFGYRINQPAEYLKGATGIIKDVALRAGIDIDRCYYTSVCKWLLPRMKRAKPPVKILKWGLPILMDEIKRTKPKIIVCLGKQAFDLLSDRKIGFDDAHGGWFWSTEAQAHLYLMYAPYSLVGKPELYETFRIDFMEIARKKKLLDGEDINDLPVRYDVIRDEQSLRDWVGRMEELYDDRIPGVPQRYYNAANFKATIPKVVATPEAHAKLRQSLGGSGPAPVLEPGGTDLSGNCANWHKNSLDPDHFLFAVDCEWHGRTHVDGQLRTIQFAWTESDAVVIEFRNEQNEWSFELDHATARDVGSEVVQQALSSKWQEGETYPSAATVEKQRYAAVGRILAGIMNKKDVRYIGHHFSADAPWMEHWLGLNTYRRCIMDTEFAQQTVDEASELGLERGIAMKYTTLGMYNLDLILWKKDNPGKTDGGYGFIPSDILIPYSVLDVIAPFRAAPLIRRQLEAQQLTKYYDTILNPFVTDTFTDMCMEGLPMDVKLMDELRELFHFARRELEVRFKERVHKEAKTKLAQTVFDEMTPEARMRVLLCIKEGDGEKILEAIKRHAPMEDIPKWIKRVGHFVDAPNFNIRSPDMMRRWLFDVEGLEPIKTTNQKAKGLPSMAWEKVLELPADRQRLYTPAVDKQTLQILSEQFGTLNELLDLNAVGNVCKAFLKEADTYIDDDGNEVRSENGLHQWLASDNRVHGMTSLTETGRTRTWKPNSLNWPKYVSERIGRSIELVVREAHERGELPEHLMKWVGVKAKKLPSIRSCVTAPEGYCLVEFDYKTAEMVALSKISYDLDLMRILEEPDPEWASLKGDNPYKIKQVRVAFSDPMESGIPVDKQNPDYIMNAWKNGKNLGPVTEEMLARNADGSVKHSGYDIHWSIAERIYEDGREMMDADIQRAAGKVINFCLATGQLILTDRGWIPIEQLSACDLLWDGVEWVSHAGLHDSGIREVNYHDGLWATPGHNVWAEGGKIRFEEARSQQIRLVHIGGSREGTESGWPDHLPGDHSVEGVRLLLPYDGVPELRQAAGEGAAEHGEGTFVEVPLPEGRGTRRLWSTPSPDADIGVALQRHDAALLQDDSRIQPGLQGTGDQGPVRESTGLCDVGGGEVAGGDLQGEGLRPQGQRRRLLEGESSAGDALREFVEQAKVRLAGCRDGQGVSGQAPAGDLHSEDHTGTTEAGLLGEGNSGEVGRKRKSRLAQTYDILNVGPRRRFFCAGVLVSNSSAYGASPNSLERKIESDTGVKPEEGVGQKGLDAIKARQPRATEFLEEMANLPKTKGYYRAASGRIRHCLLHGAGSGVGWRIRNSLESALGRELKNVA